VDVKAATKKGIPVANVPDYCIDEVADHTMALVLCTARKVIPAREQTKSGQWDLKQFFPIPALKDSTLGLIGFGRVPRAVAKRAKCFGLNVQTTDPFISAEVAAEHGVKLASLEELLSSSDFVSVHLPLSEETRGMFSAQEFAMMKPSAVFINTSRGPVVNEDALREALQSGKIAFAALDVLKAEPPLSDNPLLRMDNVIVTPHIAWYSERSIIELGIHAGEEIVRVLKGYRPKSLVNPDVLKVRPDLKQAE
jgi:D-3-phosphoglycerate dehydrogenase